MMKFYFGQLLMHRFAKHSAGAIILTIGFILVSVTVNYVSAAPVSEQRHYDARLDFNRGYQQKPMPQQQQAVSSLALEIPDLTLSFDTTTGSIRSLTSQTGFLTPAKVGQKPLSVAMDFLKTNAVMMGLSRKDIASLKVIDRVFSGVTGATHVYMGQEYEGLMVYNSQVHMNMSRDQRILSVNNSAMLKMEDSVNQAQPGIDLAEAVSSALKQLDISLSQPLKPMGSPSGPQQISTIDPADVSLAPIEGRLMWLPIRNGMMRLVWNFQIHTLDRQHVYDFTVDAVSGEVWTRFDWVASDQYRVYARPVESPNHTTPLPPADGRTLVSNPANTNASPFAWHDSNGSAGAEFTTTRGNNVHAYADTNGDDSPDAGAAPEGGASLRFDFNINLNSQPGSYRNAAVTNLFYWNNIIHDVQYQYGFDEAAGNFQINNYGKGGRGNDAVRAEAQDGSGINNANFLTLPDGSVPRMQMFLWNRSNPQRDGDLDNGIIIHEYGHGISNRLVGGPANVNCLTNSQQPGEGLSDWWSLVYTAKAGDKGTDPRGIGTYAFGQPTSGDGIRDQPYSTDPSVNTWTYASINGKRIPHGVGAVWAQAAWEVYWALVDHWGFDANLYIAQGNAGNQRMMLYVNEGLKNTACNPTFTQVRDGIIDAAKLLHGGEDVCRIWKAFAAFGLGSDAVSGGPNSTSPRNGFAVPASCQIDNTAPATAITSPVAGASVRDTITIRASASDAVGVTQVEFYVDNKLEQTDSTAPYNYNWDTTLLMDGDHSIFSKAYDVAGNVGTSNTVAVKVNNSGGLAVYDATLKAPKCANVASSCDSGNLLVGRDGKGPEPNRPNTIKNSCTDGASGSFHDDESIDRVVISTTDGSPFASGKLVRVEITLWAWTTPAQDHLDLYFASEANNPSWTFIKTVTPTVPGQQTLSTTYKLPTGDLQAVRTRFRYQQSAASCGNGSYDDYDDLIFAVNSVAPPGPGPGPGPASVIFSDDFESDVGWIVNAAGSDTATTGKWERGNPEPTESNGPKQLGTTVSGVNDLVTGRRSGSSVGSQDIDRGVTSIQSPIINLPSNGDLKLKFSYYFAHINSSSDDFLRIRVVGNVSSTVFEKRGASGNRNAIWNSTTQSLNAFAGQSVRLIIEAADVGRGSIVEAGIDDIKIIRE